MTTLPTTVDPTMLISAAGYDRLCSELETLRTGARRALAERLREARDDGDLDDNPTLHDLLQEQAQLEERIAVLEVRMRSAEIAELDEDGRAGVGTLVEVRDLRTGSQHEYELVGALEPDVGSGRVSVEAPVGRALVGRLPGERLAIETPRGLLDLELVSVRPAVGEPREQEAA